VAIAAADNHSLCVTACGSVYAWGSNRFGQVGTTCGSSGTVDESNSSNSTRCLPRRVDDLKNVFCVSVAAGEKHSVALSRQGEVYVWGDNTAGRVPASSITVARNHRDNCTPFLATLRLYRILQPNS
jgi:alpha-tubulin suppressor-like RCC1 family protein